MKRILVAVDGSKFSQKALFKAKEIAEALQAEVTILTVVNTQRDNVYSYVNNRELRYEMNRSALKHGDEIIQKSKEIFSDFKGTYDTVQKTGDTVEEIVSYAEEGAYDLVILGSRGAGVFTRTLLGSVSDKVVHHIKTSVLIVK